MTTEEALQMTLANQRAQAWFGSLSVAAKIEHLQTIGILDRNRRLAKRYGGDGDDVVAAAEADPPVDRPQGEAGLQPYVTAPLPS